MLLFYLLLRVVIIALATNYQFVYNNKLIACLYPLWIYFVHSLSYAIEIYVYLAAFIYCSFTILINRGAQSALPLRNVRWLACNHTFMLCWIFLFLFLHFRERIRHTHIHAHTQGRRLSTMVSCVQVTHGLWTMLTRRVVPEDICYVTLGRIFVQHCQKQREDRTVLELQTSLGFELVSVLIHFSLKCKENSASDQFLCFYVDFSATKCDNFSASLCF